MAESSAQLDSSQGGQGDFQRGSAPHSTGGSQIADGAYGAAAYTSTAAVADAAKHWNNYEPGRVRAAIEWAVDSCTPAADNGAAGRMRSGSAEGKDSTETTRAQ